MSTPQPPVNAGESAESSGQVPYGPGPNSSTVKAPTTLGGVTGAGARKKWLQILIRVALPLIIRAIIRGLSRR